MNNLLLLAGLVLVVCLMNSKGLMNSDLVKSVSSKSKSVSKSLGVDSSTLLVVVFVGAILFMCMSKKVEGFSGLNESGKCDENAPNKHNLSVVDNNNIPLYKYVTVCLTDNEKGQIARNPIPLTNRCKYENLSNNGNITRPSNSDDSSDDSSDNSDDEAKKKGEN